MNCCVFRNQEPRFPINIGITGHVASTGEVGEFSRNCREDFDHKLNTCSYGGLFLPMLPNDSPLNHSTLP